MVENITPSDTEKLPEFCPACCEFMAKPIDEIQCLDECKVSPTKKVDQSIFTSCFSYSSEFLMAEK